MEQKVKGKWIKSSDLGASNTAAYKTTQPEAYKRLDAIHDMMLKIYPQPIGVDASWHRAIGISYFGTNRKYYNRESGRTFEYLNLPHFAKYYYTCGFFAYYCGNGNFMWPGITNETGTWITVTANDISGAIGGGDETWMINGLPVGTRPSVLKTLNSGFEMLHPELSSNAGYILLHREGMLPYIPVTRKQYLDQCIAYRTEFHDKLIGETKKIPVRSLEEQEKEKKAQVAQFEKDFGKNTPQYKSAADYYFSGYLTDQQQRNELVEKMKKIKEEELKKFRDELEKTTKEGLLDTPAIVLDMFYADIIFSTDPQKAKMLVTENPDYIRKDLPKHIPQFFVLSWTWGDWAPQKEIGRIIEENFPFDKLLAMIDK